MGEMVNIIFESFTDVISNLADGIKTAFMHILYTDPNAAEKVISDPVKFALIFAGVTLASGLVVSSFRWIRNRK